MTEANYGRRHSLDLQFQATVLPGGMEITHDEFGRMCAVTSMKKSTEVWTNAHTLGSASLPHSWSPLRA